MLQLVFTFFICLRRFSKISQFQKLKLCLIGGDHLSLLKVFLLTARAEGKGATLLFLSPQIVWEGEGTQGGVTLLFWKHADKGEEENFHRDI